jgi:hypothetical protein
MYPLPEKVREGLTWRRFRNALRSPTLLWHNARFWWNDEVSESEHIFVLGPPRSGTTLVKNVVQSHTDVCGIEGESWFFLRANYADVCLPGISADTEARIVQTSQSVTGLFDRWADVIKKRTVATYFLEKTPESALRLDYITSHFPESHIVFIVRDPRDGLRSAQNFPGYWATLPDADRVGGYLATWKRSVRAYLHHAEHETMIRVRYEDFCREPEAQLSALSDKIGIEVQEHQLDPAAYGETEVSMNEAHSRLRQPITPDSIGRWRQELSKDEVARIERTLADEMKALDYELTLE